MNQRLRHLLIAIMVLFTIQPISGDISMPKNTETLIEKTLHNGVKVFLLVDKSSSLVSARTYVRAGSIDESIHPGSGLSHYLEHIVAGGTTEANSEDYYKTLISKMGGAYNAYTTVDHTSYYINTTPEYAQDAVSTLGEWMFQCSFKDFEYNRERDVIIKEIEKTQAHIGRKFYHLASNNFYKNHPLRYPVIGYLPNFKNITRDELMSYYNSYYVPSNIVLVVGGNIDAEETLKTIEASFGQAERKAQPQPASFPEPVPFSQRFEEKEDITNTTHISIRFSTIDLYHTDLYALDLLDFILSNGEGSILYKEIVENQKLAYSVSASSYTPSHTTGYFDISAEIDYENKDAFIAAITSILNEIKKGKSYKHLINRAKKQKIADDILGIANIEDKVARVGQSYLYGYSSDFYDKYVSNFKQVNKDDIQAVAERYFDFDRQVISILKPSSEEKVSTAKKEKEDTSLPIPKMTTLANGVKLIYHPDNSIPKTHFQIMMLGGTRIENDDDSGIGSILSRTLGKSSQRFDKEALQSYFEEKGAEIDAHNGNNTFFYTLTSLSEDFEELLPIFIHTFTDPEFTKEEIEEAKRKQLQSISQRKDDWFSYSMYQFKKDFFKTHPLRLSGNGEKESVEKLTHSDIENHFKKMVVPSDIIISVSGDYDEKAITKTLTETFSNLPEQESVTANISLERTLHTKPSQKTLDIPQEVAGIFVGFDGSTFTNEEDNLKIDLMDAVLSGMGYPAGRLHPILREKGHVYMVHATNRLGIEKGFFMIYALSSPDRAEEVIRIIKEQIKDIQTKEISDEEFELAKAQMHYYYLERLSTIENLSVISSTDEMYGRGHDYYTKAAKGIETLTKQDVKDMATKYLSTPQTYIFQQP